MNIKMLRSRMYRETPLEAGRVAEVDAQTAEWFIAQGWAEPHQEAAPLTVEQADSLVPTKVTRRRAKR